MWPGVTSCDQLWPAVTSCQSTSKTVKKHVFGHISAQENALQAKTGQNDRKVNGFHQKKFGGNVSKMNNMSGQQQFILEQYQKLVALFALADKLLKKIIF